MSNDIADLNATRMSKLEAKVDELDGSITLAFELQTLFTVITFALALASFCMSLWLIFGQG